MKNSAVRPGEIKSNGGEGTKNVLLPALDVSPPQGEAQCGDVRKAFFPLKTSG